MKKSDLYVALNKLEKAVQSLRQAVDTAHSDLEKDGTIQRFEFTVELLWKTFKIMLNYYGVECSNPRSCIKEAFRNRIIEDDEILLDMLEDRNISLHIYDETTSIEIFNKIKDIYINILEKIVADIKGKL